MKKRLALITWSGLPQGAESERLMLPHLTAANVETEIVDWRLAGCDFSKLDLIVLRSCWDYHLRVTEFIDWLRRAAQATPVLNAVETVLWNHTCCASSASAWLTNIVGAISIPRAWTSRK